jgi:hypothetical protein
MVVAVRISAKDFNDDKLQEELAQASLPIQGITWAGFIRSGERLHTPFPEASRVVGTSSSDGDDVALRGGLRFSIPSPLTPTEDTSLDSVLAAHNSATLAAEQVRQNQDNTDLDTLLATDRPSPHCDRLAGIFEGCHDGLAERMGRLSQAPRLFGASTNLLHDLFTSLGQHGLELVL